MKCICCEGSPSEFRFEVQEVHTLHVRDFGGEKLIQALGDKKEFSVCTACAQSELRAVLFPAGRIARKCAGFVVLVLAGLVMTLTVSLQDVMNALRVLGPLCVFVGMSGIISRVRDMLSRRRLLAGMDGTEALKLSAWQCVLNSAPKKYNDNDITYIPLDEARNLTAEELAGKYGLLPQIARRIKSEG